MEPTSTEVQRQPSLQPKSEAPSAMSVPGGNPLGANAKLAQGNDVNPSSSGTSSNPRPRSPLRHSPIPLPRPTSVSSLLQADIGPLDQFRDREMNLPGSRPLTPRGKVKTPRSLTPQSIANLMGDGAQLLGPAVPRSPDASAQRPLNVSDALGYLDAVKTQFQDKPDVYNHFLDIMKDFKSQAIDTPGVIHRVSMLFQGNPLLIQGFNTFLPPGYRIELSSDPKNLNGITVTTPTGTLDPFNTQLRFPREPPHPPNAMTHLVPAPPVFGGHGPPPLLPVGLGPGSRPTTPLNHGLPPHIPSAFVDAPQPYSPALQGAQSAAASFLGGLGNRAAEKPQSGEFNHAIQFLNKIKIRYSDEPDIYKQFLEILQTYQKEQKHLHDSQVYAQVARLFRDAPDLMEEFKDFLPDALGHTIQVPAAGLVGIMPHPAAQGSTSTWDVPDASTSGIEKPVKPPARRRKRAADKDANALPKAATGRNAKRAKLNHSKPDPPSPKFSPYQRPPSPESLHHSTRHLNDMSQAQQQLVPPQMQLQHVGPAMMAPSLTEQGEVLFLEKAKKTLENLGLYEDFLKLLHSFAKEVIDVHALIQLSEPLLSDGDLFHQFKELMGWDDKKGNVEHGPPGSIRTSAPDPQAAICPDDDEGPSYRRLPSHETRLACSGRDQLAWSVLNDQWVSHPTWASEESGFLTHKKNSFEETLHRSEEERHEYQTHIDAITRTIAVLDPVNTRLNEMKVEERAHFRLGPDLGGWSPTIYQKTIKKVYGREHWHEIYVGLQENPVTAVPIVLSRLKQKNEEWRRQQREWNRTWREVDAKNFYKALDHQGITFKANDKKNITAKYFVQDIENIKSGQAKKAEDSTGSEPLSYQLEYDFQDKEVLEDTLKLIYSFLDHATPQYVSSERRSVEQFLKPFIPTLFAASSRGFDVAPVVLNGSLENPADESIDGSKSAREANGRQSVSGAQSAGVPAGDLRKRLLKTVQEGTPSRAAKQSRSSGSASPVVGSSSRTPRAANASEDTAKTSSARSKPEDMWIMEVPVSSPGNGAEAGDAPVHKRPFFTSTTFYTLLRLLQLMYSRLLICKEIGAEMAREKHASLLANPVAVNLGLDEPNGPSVVLAQAIEAVGQSASEEPTNVVYEYLLEACEKVFANELDQATFEEHMRWFFRTKAYHVFTLDKVITAIIKQVQTIQGDNKCQDLWDLLENNRKKDSVTIYDIVRYRREAEHHVGSDDHLYRVDCERESRRLRIQLLSKEDPSVNEDRSAVGRWREYVATYVLRHPTEWSAGSREARRAPVYLKRNLIDMDGDNRQDENESRLCIRVSLGTYRLFYEAGKEDVVLPKRRPGEEATLAARARARSEERRRSRWLK